jgi:hypothetical protein
VCLPSRCLEAGCITPLFHCCVRVLLTNGCFCDSTVLDGTNTPQYYFQLSFFIYPHSLQVFSSAPFLKHPQVMLCPRSVRLYLSPVRSPHTYFILMRPLKTRKMGTKNDNSMGTCISRIQFTPHVTFRFARWGRNSVKADVSLSSSMFRN